MAFWEVEDEPFGEAKCKRKSQNPENGWKTLKSKKFACPGSNFERLANLGLFSVKPAKTGLNFETSHPHQDVVCWTQLIFYICLCSLSLLYESLYRFEIEI
jgi:hypothetical protein